VEIKSSMAFVIDATVGYFLMIYEFVEIIKQRKELYTITFITVFPN
jgi:hypothetical protein